MGPWAHSYPFLPHTDPLCMHCPVQPWHRLAAHSLCRAVGTPSQSPKLCSCGAAGPALLGSPSNLTHILSVPLPPPVDQSMFENASAGTAPAPRAQHVPAAAGTLPQPCRPAGSQHLRNLGKAVGAKVNDLLRRREPAGLPAVGAMEVNPSAGTVLGTGQPAAEHG